MVGWQTKQAAFSRGHGPGPGLRTRELNLIYKSKRGHLWPTRCMEKHYSLKALPSKVVLVLHNIHKSYPLFFILFLLVTFRKSWTVSFVWDVGRADCYGGTTCITYFKSAQSKRRRKKNFNVRVVVLKISDGRETAACKIKHDLDCSSSKSLYSVLKVTSLHMGRCSHWPRIT